MKDIETPRTTIRPFALTDAAFIVRLLNEPSFIENIADKGVRTLADARDYLRDGPLASYREHGFGLWCVTLTTSDEPIGMCGILQRDFLDDPDLGYALLPEHCGQGLAQEACHAVLAFATDTLAINRCVAIVSDDNDRSIHLLDKLGFKATGKMQYPDTVDEVLVYAWSTGA